jgi:AbiV family abortive infection protein
MSATPEHLLRGAALALEQCGLLLGDAVCLYRNRSYASAVVMAAFAREELGRFRILRDFRQDVLNGLSVTSEQIIAACKDHVAKQSEGMFSSTLRADRDTVVGKLLIARMTNPPQSQAWKDADAQLNKIIKRKDERTPNDRHLMRMRALYVEPKSSVGWNRPADVTEAEAQHYLMEAVNDYAGPYNNPDVRGLLGQLTDGPELPRPVWPKSGH